MSYRTLNSFTVKPTWPTSWGTVDAKLVIALDRDVVSEDGIQYQGGKLGASALKGLGFYFSSDITITNGVASAALIANLPTTDTSTPANTALYHVYIYVKGHLKEKLGGGKGFHLHESINGATTTFNWSQWVNAQQWSQGNSQLPMIGDRATMQGMLDAALLTKQDSSVVLDIWATKTAPSGAVVGTTDSQALTNKTIAGGSNLISGITESMLSTSDVTTLNATSLKHGFLPKLSNSVADVLRGDGTFGAVAATVTFTAPTLSGSWSNAGSGNANAGYAKVNGIVFLQGAVTGGSGTIFTLPAGFRPAATKNFAVIGNNTIAYVSVSASGAVVLVAGTAPIAVDGISFPAEQ